MGHLVRGATPQSTTADIDAEEVRRAVVALFAPDASHEVCLLVQGQERAFRTGSRTISASNADTVLAHLNRVDGDNVHGIYWTINTVRPDLEGQAKKSDIINRRWLYLDFDPRRLKGTNSTDEEHRAAEDAAHRCREYLLELGWPEPVMVDSGNGWGLFSRIDLPATAHAHALLKRITHKLGSIYSNDAVEVDDAVHNDSRLARLPGTMNRKGPHSSERPRRRCRIAILPKTIEVVPEAKLADLAGPDAPARTPPSKRAGGHKAGGGYWRKAFDNEIANVRASTDGNRHTQLNTSAFLLYTIVAAGHLDDAEVTAALLDASLSTGYPESEGRSTIESARKDGLAQPRAEPEQRNGAARNGKAPKGPRPSSKADHTPVAQKEDNSPVCYRASSVKPRAVQWLWPNRVPLGKLTTFAGHGGLGKTFVLLDMTARVTTGVPWPDGAAGSSPSSVLFISGEDDPDDTLVPRLIELKADLDRVLFLKTARLERFTLADLDTLDKALEQNGEDVRLVVIDPPTAYLAGTDDHKNAELRQLLTPLQEWAKYWNSTIIFNTHVNKGGAGKVEAMARVMGSVAWTTAVRSAHMFAKDPDDLTKRVFIPMKNNIGPERKGLSYRIDARPNEMAHVEWLGEIDTTADQAVNAPLGTGRQKVAAEWLIDRFRERREWLSDDLFRAAKEHGVSRNAVFEAKKVLNLPTARVETGEGGTKTYLWWVPEDWQPPQPKAKAPAGEQF